MSAANARLRKVLSTPKKTSASGLPLLRMALFSAEPVSPDFRNWIEQPQRDLKLGYDRFAHAEAIVCHYGHRPTVVGVVAAMVGAAVAPVAEVGAAVGSAAAVAAEVAAGTAGVSVAGAGQPASKRAANTNKSRVYVAISY
jgi:hypothetical protein